MTDGNLLVSMDVVEDEKEISVLKRKVAEKEIEEEPTPTKKLKFDKYGALAYLPSKEKEALLAKINQFIKPSLENKECMVYTNISITNGQEKTIGWNNSQYYARRALYVIKNNGNIMDGGKLRSLCDTSFCVTHEFYYLPKSASRGNKIEMYKDLIFKMCKVNPITGCWIWQGGTDQWGSGRMTCDIFSKTNTTYRVERLSYMLFNNIDKLPEKAEVKQIHCSGKLCCFNQHLGFAIKAQTIPEARKDRIVQQTPKEKDVSKDADDWIRLKNAFIEFELPQQIWSIIIRKDYLQLEDQFPNKICRGHDIYHLLTKFNANAKSIDGKRSECKELSRLQQKRLRDIKFCLMRLYLQYKKCVDCGENDPVVLDNDHISDNKHRRKNGKVKDKITAATIDKIMAELLKCEVVCRVCHQRRTVARQQAKPRSQNPSTIQKQELIRSLREIVNTEKQKIGKCDCCKLLIKDDYSSFDFNHLNPDDKIESISQMVIHQRPLNMILEEIKKCNLLCGNCHRRHTAIQSGQRKLSDYPEDIIREAQKILDKGLIPKKNT